MKQGTIKTSISLTGNGLHTGSNVNLTIHPAAENHGIQFKRIDLEGQPLIKSDAGQVVSTNRCTTLGKKEVTVSTVEHLLAALTASGVSNVLIEIDAPEVPILDGSAIPFIEAIEAVGVEEQEADRNYLRIEEPFVFEDEDSGASYTILPAEKLEITTLVDFGSSVIGKQFASLDNLSDFAAEIAPARTFVFLHELEQLANAGLAQGGQLDNAVVFVNQIPAKDSLQSLAKQFGVEEEVAVAENGILNTTALRFQNEAARHKLLDIVGDLALANIDLQAKIIATKPGHSGNTKLAQKLKQLYKKSLKTRDIPKYDPNIPPVNDIHAITKKIQHRYPFLLIDKIIKLTSEEVVGVKNVTMNEQFFTGHFPDNPVMPGVLQIEAMAQTGGILMMEHIDDPHSYDTFFLRINNARFRKPVVPGDTILFKMELMSPIRRGLCEMSGKAYVGDTLVSEAELLAQIIKR
jgi:UDP-3-O-[3-hydroxymyristoyl] N-acetylglucosamine deacetylase/3-hydroxyacyl-[acyl-carrier-protein] dehydratase